MGIDRTDISKKNPSYWIVKDALEAQTRDYTQCDEFETCQFRDNLSTICLDTPELCGHKGLRRRKKEQEW